MKDSSLLITEFEVSGSMKMLLALLNEVVQETEFSLKPLRLSHENSYQQSFQVISENPRTNERYCCGTIDFIRRKANKVVIKFDSTRGTMSSFEPVDHVPMERFFYVIVQRLVQRRLV